MKKFFLIWFFMIDQNHTKKYRGKTPVHLFNNFQKLFASGAREVV